jgi:hypothetical protein
MPCTDLSCSKPVTDKTNVNAVTYLLLKAPRDLEEIDLRHDPLNP